MTSLQISTALSVTAECSPGILYSQNQGEEQKAFTFLLHL